MNKVITQPEHPLLKPNILEEAKTELFKVVNASIAKCYADLNFKIPDDQAVNYLVNQVTESILEKFPSLRLHEIPTAFSKGIRYEYGEYYGLCVISFEKFIEGYLNSDYRAKLVEEKNRLQLEEKTEPTREDKFNTAKIISLEAYNRVKANVSINLTATTVFAFLNALGLIEQDYKTGYPKEAIPQMVKERETEAGLCMELMKRKRLNAELEILKENIANDFFTQEQANECTRVAKKIIITNWMQGQLTNEVDLDKLIESKRAEYLNAN